MHCEAQHCDTAVDDHSYLQDHLLNERDDNRDEQPSQKEDGRVVEGLGLVISLHIREVCTILSLVLDSINFVLGLLEVEEGGHAEADVDGQSHNGNDDALAIVCSDFDEGQQH
jgi:hypothetical protein